MLSPSRPTEAGGLSSGVGIAVPTHIGMSLSPLEGPALPTAHRVVMYWISSIVPGGFSGCVAVSSGRRPPRRDRIAYSLSVGR
eukprot:536411-Pyramimonas_sp.AAC.1